MAIENAIYVLTIVYKHMTEKCRYFNSALVGFMSQKCLLWNLVWQSFRVSSLTMTSIIPQNPKTPLEYLGLS